MSRRGKPGQGPTRADVPFHHIKLEYGAHALENGITTGLLTREDVLLIQEFVYELMGKKGISVGRANKLVFMLKAWRQFIGPYSENTARDLNRGLTIIRSPTTLTEKGRPYKRNTLYDMIYVLKRFYRWMLKHKYTTIPSEEIEEITPPRVDTMTKTVAQLPTRD